MLEELGESFDCYSLASCLEEELGERACEQRDGWHGVSSWSGMREREEGGSRFGRREVQVRLFTASTWGDKGREGRMVQTDRIRLERFQPDNDMQVQELTRQRIVRSSLPPSLVHR